MNPKRKIDIKSNQQRLTMQLILDVMLEQQQQQHEVVKDINNEKPRRSSYSSQETASTAPYWDDDEDDDIEDTETIHVLDELVMGDSFKCCNLEQNDDGDYFENEGSISFDALDAASESAGDDELNDSYVVYPEVAYTGRSAILHVILEETELDLILELEDEEDICAFIQERDDYQLLESLVSFSESWIVNENNEKQDHSHSVFSDSLEGSFIIPL